MFYPSLCLLTL